MVEAGLGLRGHAHLHRPLVERRVIQGLAGVAWLEVDFGGLHACMHAGAGWRASKQQHCVNHTSNSRHSRHSINTIVIVILGPGFRPIFIHSFNSNNRFWPGSGLVLRCLGPGFTVLALGPGFRPIFNHSIVINYNTLTLLHDDDDDDDDSNTTTNNNNSNCYYHLR